jgi:uncharacterized membrane protein YjjP (DUF1212 family)
MSGSFKVVRAYQVNYKKSLDTSTGLMYTNEDVMQEPTVDVYNSEEDYMRQYNAIKEHNEKLKKMKQNKTKFSKSKTKMKNGYSFDFYP